MKQKLTVLSIASVIALTPLSFSIAQANAGTGSNQSASSYEPSSSSAETNASHPEFEEGTNTDPGHDAVEDYSSDSERNNTADDEADSETDAEDHRGMEQDSDADDASETEADYDTEEDRGSDHASESEAAAEFEAEAETEAESGDGTGSTESHLEDTDEFEIDSEELFQLHEDALEDYLDQQEEEFELFLVEQDGDFESNVADLRASLEENPEDLNLYVELAVTYLVNGDVSGAAEVSNQLNTLAPDSYLSLILQAELAGAKNNSADKQLYLEKALETNPNSSVARFKLGEELVKAGKYEEATSHLMIAAALHPDSSEVFEQLNQIFAQNENPELTTFVNGVIPEFDVKPFIEDGRTLMPIRAISETLGANVGWDENTELVSIQHGTVTIELTINSNVAIVNGQEVTIDAPAKIVDGSTVLPLRFVGESLGVQVDWKPEGNMIVITE